MPGCRFGFPVTSVLRFPRRRRLPRSREPSRGSIRARDSGFRQYGISRVAWFSECCSVAKRAE